MSKQYFLYFLLLMWQTITAQRSSPDFCDTTLSIRRVFNIGHNVYINNMWIYDAVNHNVLNEQFNSERLFETTVKRIFTGFSFIFAEQCSEQNHSSYCNAISKASDLLVVVGIIGDKAGYACYEYHDSIGQIRLIKGDSDMPWSLHTTGDLTSDFWKIPEIISNFVYKSIAFDSTRNELYATIVLTTSGHKYGKHYLYSRKLDKNGLFSDHWKRVRETGFRGMFYLNRKLFGLDSKQMIWQIKWKTSDIPYFEKIANIKEFFNCYNNSTQSDPNAVTHGFLDVTDGYLEKSSAYGNSVEPITMQTQRPSISSLKPTTMLSTDAESSDSQTSQTLESEAINEEVITTGINEPIQQSSKSWQKSKFYMWTAIGLLLILIIISIIVTVIVVIIWKNNREREKRISLLSKATNKS